MDDAGRATLRRILGAYAARNGAVGYCQGLNFLAAALMLFMGEEDAFWSLCAVVEDLLGSAYFDERMVLPQVGGQLWGAAWAEAEAARRCIWLLLPVRVKPWSV